MSIEDQNKPLPEKSKTRKKIEAQALQELGAELAALNEEQLHKIHLPEQLLDAILLYQKITQHGGRKRQLQYIGKLMRDIDPQPIKQAIQDMRLQHQRETASFHQIEQWREQLLEGSAQIVDDLLIKFPNLDVQHIRQLVRNAHKEQQLDKAPKSARALFKYLHSLLHQS